MKAFVQVDKNGEFHNHNHFDAWRGFGLRGYEVIKFNDKRQIWDVTKETPVFAGVSTFSTVLKYLGVNHIELPSYPRSLSTFLQRDIRVTSLQEARTMVSKNIPVFIKPLDKNRKVFSGH